MDVDAGTSLWTLAAQFLGMLPNAATLDAITDSTARIIRIFFISRCRG
jgi:hypothetical protein